MTLHPVAPDRIAARRRPAAILAVFAWELAWALLVAMPVHTWARRVWGAHPDGDAVLWAPGGRELFVFVLGGDAAEATALRVTAILLFLGVLAMQVPLGVLLASLALGRDDEGRAPRLWSARGAAAPTLMPLLGVLVAVGAIELAVLGLGGLAASAVDRAFSHHGGDASAARIAIATFGLFGVLALVVGVFGDLVRAAVAREVVTTDERPAAWVVVGRATRRAFAVGRRGFLSALAQWTWRVAVVLLLVGVGALASDRLGGRGGLALAGLFAVHQLLVLGRTALRASWFARALRLVSLSS